jgi:hypothetical protein
MVGPVNTQVLASGQRRSLQAAPLGRSPRVPTLGVFPSSQPQTLGAHFNPSGLAPACIPARRPSVRISTPQGWPRPVFRPMLLTTS